MFNLNKFRPKKETAIADSNIVESESLHEDEKEQTIAAIKAELYSKWKQVMGNALGSYGTGNAYAAGEMMFDALFAREATSSRHGYTSPLPEGILNPGRISPDKEEFVSWFRDTMIHDEKLQKECAFPGATEAVDAMTDAGPLVIWTEGDTLNSFDGAPGSGEQLEKIRGIGAHDIGLTKALSSIALSHGIEYGTDPGKQLVEDQLETVVTSEASESKFSPDVIERIVERFKKQNISRVVVLEDRLSNAERMRSILEQKGFDATGIWVRQGRHGRKEMSHDETVIDAASILEASSIVTELRAHENEQIGIVCDFDGVLGDQEKREAMQIDALYNECQKNGWLAE